MEDDLPIDIDYSKFLSWLISRNKIPRKYPTYLRTLRENLARAVDLLPPGFPCRLPLHYYAALETLKELTEPSRLAQWGLADATDLLGRYKDPCLRAWADVVRQYEKNHLHLAESAKRLAENVDVEGPALRKNIAKLQSVAAEGLKKELAARKALEGAEERFRKACEAWEIQEDCGDFVEEVRRMADRKAPLLIEKAVECLREPDVVRAVEYYEEFAIFMGGASVKHEEVCSTLKRVRACDLRTLTRKEQDTAVESYEIEIAEKGIVEGHNTKPPERKEVEESRDNGSENVITIDWGVEVDTEYAGAVAESSLEAQNASKSAMRVDRDRQSDSEKEFNVVRDGKHEIKEISRVQDRATPREETLPDDSTFYDSEFKSHYLDDLFEVRAFLVQRGVELSNSGSSSVQLIMQSSIIPEKLRAVDSIAVEKYLRALESAIDAINGSAARKLLALWTNRGVLEQTAREIEHKMRAVDRMRAAMVTVRKKRTDALKELEKEVPRLERLRRETKELKNQVEKELEKQFPGRTVNIMGQINMFIKS